MKFKIWLYNIIDVMRAIPFDITNEFCRCDFWWDGDCQMYMIFNTTNAPNLRHKRSPDAWKGKRYASGWVREVMHATPSSMSGHVRA